GMTNDDGSSHKSDHVAMLMDADHAHGPSPIVSGKCNQSTKLGLASNPSCSCGRLRIKEQGSASTRPEQNQDGVCECQRGKKQECPVPADPADQGPADATPGTPAAPETSKDQPPAKDAVSPPPSLDPLLQDGMDLGLPEGVFFAPTLGSPQGASSPEAS